MEYADDGNWTATAALPAGGVFFYKYVVKTLFGFRWQEGANNLLVLPEAWDTPADCTFVAGDYTLHFSAQLEPRLKQPSTLHTLDTPQHPLHTGYTTPTLTPEPR